ncbi:MAG: transcription elongation factor GreA [Pseudomonadota bacterium]
MDRVPLTERGAQMLRDELRELKTKDRPEIIQAIAEAREHGDLKENAEYHAAKERQGFIEGRIKDLEGKLSNAQVIDVTEVDGGGKVIFGSTVTLYDIDNDKEVTYQIVGQDEADIKAGLISVTSPIARGLIGKREGDEVSVTTPGGQVPYEVLSVQYI